MTIPASRFAALEVSRYGMHILEFARKATQVTPAGHPIFEMCRTDCTIAELVAAFRADCTDRKRKFQITLTDMGYCMRIRHKAFDKYAVIVGEMGNGKNSEHETLSDMIDIVETHIMFYLCGGDI